MGSLGLHKSAELVYRLPAGFSSVQARAQIVLDVHLEMAFHLGGEFPLAPVFAKEPGEPKEQRAQTSHADSFPGARKRARISVVCSHSRASLSNCLRPARVSL